MDTKGQHLVIDAYGCQADILNDEGRLKELLIKTVNDVGMEILSVYFHSFTPQGVTGVIVLSTSHLSIHTWPEHNYAALDLYTCGDKELLPAIEELLKEFQSTRASICELSRGEGKNGPALRNMELGEEAGAASITEAKEVFRLSNGRGNNWDRKQLKEILNSKHKMLYKGASEFQEIVLVETNDLRLYLDQELQFSSLDERHYHEALVFPAMELAAAPERVLILGGGDGLAMREVLKYPSVKHADLVDIDPVIIQLATTHPVMLAHNNRSLLNEKVTVHVRDAQQYIMEDHQPYDVIIIDFPDPDNEFISKLYTHELFSQVAKHLSEKGVMVCQSNSPEDTPTVFWSIGETLKKAGLHTQAYNITVPSFGLWGYHLASHKKLKTPIPSITVSHQALPSDMNRLFKIPSEIEEEKEHAIVNSKKDLRLHELHREDLMEWDDLL
ncbi:adenosylmethionine decarboxylase [Bacillus sp. M6-12]|uniref:adenosylmethionine decarboxylase n=1 Tax=Bacillus sp. M6-12 TaxID=2054166 RepID=UPI000C769640|nr:adenosylmethionine decarboxylase [Bacillus sp. M6-12]PLS16036.1 adenosylmethionine decarboxylase [Bacillus sp. M6-12]